MIQTSRIKPSAQRIKRAYEEGWNSCAKMKIAIMNGRRLEVLEEVRSNYKRAKIYQFNKLAAEFASYLSDHYFIYQDDKKLGEKYAIAARSYVSLSNLETICITKFGELFRALNKTRKPKKELVNKLRKVCTEFDEYLTTESTIIWINTHTLKNIRDFIDEKYSLVVERSLEAIHHLESKGIGRTRHFYKDLTVALIRLGRYDEAVEAVDNSLQNLRKGSTIWSVLIYYKVIIELHRGNYQEAYAIFKEAERKRQINKAMGETWLIVKGFFKFLINCGKLEGPGKFKLGKFLNDIEVFTADKAGQNSNVIILKILLRLSTDRDRIIDERQRIKLYSERYLEDGSRSRLFFQMLNQIVPGNFRRAEVELRGAKYLRRMGEQEGYDPDMEILPYEDLWGMVLEGLD